MIFKEEPSMDSDTLAILQRGNQKITFITAKGDSLGDKKFSVVLWNDDSLVLAISEDFLNNEVDEKVVDLIVENFNDEYDAEFIRQRSIEVFALTLNDILDEALDSVSNPDGSNLDATIEKLLDES